MHKVELSYLLTPERSTGTLIRNPLMDQLHAVREHGSISAAARALDQSYRHIWGALKKWEQALGHPLIVWDKGQRAQLTEFGENCFGPSGRPRPDWRRKLKPCAGILNAPLQALLTTMPMC